MRPRAALALLLPLLAGAQPVARVPGFVASTFVAGLARPTSLTFAPDGRLFVPQQEGALRVVTARGVLLPTPFLTVATSHGGIDLSGGDGDGGLFSVAFDPAEGATPSHVYVQYLAPSPNDAGDRSRVSRFSVDAANPDVAVAGSEFVVFEHSVLPPRTYSHFGGQLFFGADGFLYTSHGEAHVSSNAQSLANTLGKLSRVNKDGSGAAPGNPFSTPESPNPIWALGLRNPFGAAQSPLPPHRIFVADVGDFSWEEVDEIQRGDNAGWPLVEGPGDGPAAPGLAYRPPALFYSHWVFGAIFAAEPLACCVTGGAFAAGAAVPAALGGDSFFFTDLCGKWLASMPPADASGNRGPPTLLVSGISTPLAPRVSPLDGAVYVVSVDSGSIVKVAYAPDGAPLMTQQPAADLTVARGAAALFSVSVASSASIGYQWQRSAGRGAGISPFVDVPGAASPTFIVPAAQQADDSALFRCVAVSKGVTLTSASATLHVLAHSGPTVDILSQPAQRVAAELARNSNGATRGSYSGGDSIAFAARGLDHAGAPAALAWTGLLHHEEHVHHFAGPVAGAPWTLSVPTDGEADVVQAFEVQCVATDADGMTATASAFVYPVVGSVAIATEPAKATVLVFGAPTLTPATIVRVAGMRLQLAPVAGSLWAAASIGNATGATALDVRSNSLALPMPSAAFSLRVLLSAAQNPMPTAAPSASAALSVPATFLSSALPLAPQADPQASPSAAATSSFSTSARSSSAAAAAGPALFVRIAAALVAAEMLRRAIW
jgi:hypothetical protein